jgi:sn-glycerol 3-phosphate transport system substrate-binding protein
VDRWKEEPAFRVAYEQLLSGVENVATAGPVIGDYVGVRKAVSDAISSMLIQGTDPAAALTQAAKAGDAAIEEYNARIGG